MKTMDGKTIKWYVVAWRENDRSGVSSICVVATSKAHAVWKVHTLHTMDRDALLMGVMDCGKVKP